MFNRKEAAKRAGLDWPSSSLSFPELFDTMFAPKLGHRASSFRVALSYLSEVRRPNIVETGGLRDIGNWAGDGQSTFVFDTFAEVVDGAVWSVDIDPKVALVTQQITSSRVTAVTEDSVPFLNRFSRRIDLLYLDSFDFDGNKPLEAATHHLFELCAAMHSLFAGAVVLVDDTWMVRGAPFGKGMLIAEFMRKIGKVPVCGETQMVWR
jgi:hypothetical protein